jgi:MYXO-CTERM domain-containing protein
VSTPGVTGSASRVGWLAMLLAVAAARTSRRRAYAPRSLASRDRVRAASRARTNRD